MKALALLLVGASFAGCAGAGGCEDPFPLVILAYPQVMAPEVLEVQTTLWNCTREPIPLDDPCDARDGLMPAVTVGDVEYFLSIPAGPARPRPEVRCLDTEAPARAALEPGGHLEQRFRWDGTVARGDEEPRAVAPGAYVVHVEAGAHYASKVVDVPW